MTTPTHGAPEEDRFRARAVELRRAFDETFAHTREDGTADREDFLAIRVGKERLALRRGDVAGLRATRRFEHVPSRSSELLGVAAVRGAIVPAWSLAALLGITSSERARWLVLVDREDPIGLAFDELEGMILASPDDVSRLESKRGRHVREILRSGTKVLPVVELPSIVDEIRSRAGQAGPATRGDRG